MPNDPDTAADVQQQLDDLLEHLPAGVVVHGADGRIVRANRLACELLGRSDAQLRDTESNTGVWQFVRGNGVVMPAEDFPVNIVLRTGEKASHMVVGVPSTGSPSIRWLLCNAYPDKDGAGRLRRVIVCFTDCTALKRAKQRLQKSQKRLQLVLRGSTDASWDIDLETNEIYYSERWWRMLGYKPGELRADAGLWVHLTHPDDKARVRALMHEIMETARCEYAVEFRLRHRDGHYVPVLSRGCVSRDACGRAVRISGTNSDLTERKQAERRIYELAYYDHLTGLPNRRFLIEELHKILARSHRSGRVGALLFLDLDNFKLINDTMGHDLGDMLLRQVAQRLRHALRHSDQLARLGGDEFVIVLEEIGYSGEEAVHEANHVIAKLQEVLGQPYHLADRLFSSTPSIGVVLFDGSSADIETLLRQADLAMYRAKSDGRNMARFYDAGMQAEADHHAALERALRVGLDTHQFVLFCQPQFNREGRLVGAEVLVRWQRDHEDLLGPDAFIGLAESSGLIVPLGQHVLEESCRALARWRGERVLGQLKLAVNVSVRQLRRGDFCNEVARALRDAGAPPERLCLELTESVFAENVAGVIEQMQDLCKLGVQFSLDDFGTGYSSLSYLRRLPLASLKIDRSFVHDVQYSADAVPVIEAIIALARKLRLDIVAEGVEDEAQRTFLIDGGCHALQGFLLGRPVPIAEFERTYSSAGVGHA